MAARRAIRSPCGPSRVRGRAVAIFAITAFFTCAALAHVWVRLQVVRLGYQISTETEREKQLQQVHRKLQVERALLRNPTRLQRVARNIGLAMPDPAAIQVLEPRRRGRASAPLARRGPPR